MKFLCILLSILRSLVTLSVLVRMLLLLLLNCSVETTVERRRLLLLPISVEIVAIMLPSGATKRMMMSWHRLPVAITRCRIVRMVPDRRLAIGEGRLHWRANWWWRHLLWRHLRNESERRLLLLTRWRHRCCRVLLVKWRVGERRVVATRLLKLRSVRRNKLLPLAMMLLLLLKIRWMISEIVADAVVWCCCCSCCDSSPVDTFVEVVKRRILQSRETGNCRRHRINNDISRR